VRALISNVLKREEPLNERLQLYIDLFEIFQSDIETNIQLKDIAGLFTLLDKIEDDTANIVASPSLDGGRLVYEAGYISPVGSSSRFRDESYGQFQNYINIIWDNLAFYTESPKILIINGTGKEIDPQSILGKFLQMPNHFVQFKTRIKDTELAGLRIYDLSEGEKVSTVREIQKRMPGSLVYNAEIDGVTSSDFEEDVLIVWNP
jgi:hypothetical protein